MKGAPGVKSNHLVTLSMRRFHTVRATRASPPARVATMQTMKFRTPVARTRWQDDRIDDLSGKVDNLDRTMHEEFRAVRTEMREEFRAVHARFDEAHRTMIGMHRTMILALGTIMSTMVAGFAAVLATQA